MKKSTLGIALVFMTGMSNAADMDAASSVVRKALTCDIGYHQTETVIKALKKLSAKIGKEPNLYVLPSPISIFGLNVSEVRVNADDGEGTDNYLGTFSSNTIEEVAKSAQLKPIAEDYFARETRKGNLSLQKTADGRPELGCVPKSK